MVTVHVPAGVQHAPTGGHGFGEQLDPPLKTLDPVHEALGTSEQRPVVGLQHAPNGWGHGFGVQAVDVDCQTLGLAQLACVVSVQVPAEAQQAPEVWARAG